MKFEELLKERIIEETCNSYSNNYDFYNQPFPIPCRKKIINFGKRIVFKKYLFRNFFKSDFIFKKIFLRAYKIDKYIDPLDFFYSSLEDEISKQLLLKIVTYRILGYTKVRLPLSTKEYWEGIKSLEDLADNNNFVELPYKPWKFHKHDLSSFHVPVNIYLNSKAIYTTFFIEQYKYQNTRTIAAQEGDIVLDFGGCYGDTALYFADKVGEKGKVFTFEFIPGNIDIINQNLEINPRLQERISVVDKPLWETSGEKVFYKDMGSSSRTSFKEFKGYEGTTVTVSCDDFVESNKLERVDFIKTDIEGAEPFALKGAERTIIRFKPKLAISIYHSMNDFVNIVKQISDLNAGYQFYLGHATIYASETVLFCISEDKKQ
jgi:FkbM family methyltransferase